MLKNVVLVTLSLLLPAMAQAQTAAELTPEERAARTLLADRFIDDARARGRDSTLEPRIAAAQAANLLQAANRLDPANVETLMLLAEAAKASQQSDLTRDAYRQVLRLDAGHLVAQVGFLDTVAAASQAIEQRLNTYQNAALNERLDPQVRSEMFMRVAALRSERGENAEARAAIAEALKLNDLNLSALRESARLAATERRPAGERLTALVALLKANPYETEAWLAGGRILAAANLHDSASDFFVAAIEQIRIQTGALPPTLMFEMALEMAAADRLREAVPILDSLGDIDDAPAGVNLARTMLREGAVQPRKAPATATAPASAPATGPAETQPADLVRKQLTAMLKANPDDAATIAAVLYTKLAHLSDLAADTADSVEAYAARKDADAEVAARLRGWLAFRQGDLAGARARLSPLADRDIQSALGVAQVALAEKDTAALRKVLEEIYADHPTGLTALHVNALARAGGIKLPETSLSKELSAITKALPPAYYAAHRQPRDLQLMSVAPQKRRVDFGEPLLLDVRTTNGWDSPLPVGPNAPFKTQLALAGVLRGSGGQPLGAFGIDVRHRVYRIERRQSLSYTVRIDQGLLADLLWSNPLRTMPLSISAIVDPQISATRDGRAFQVQPGVGGQTLIAGDIERTGAPLRDLLGFVRDFQALERQPRMTQLTKTAVALVLCANLPADGGKAPNAREVANARNDLILALTNRIKSDDPVLTAFAIRMAPLVNLPSDIEEIFTAQATSQDPAVLMMLAWRKQARAAALGKEALAPAIADLKTFAGTIKDPIAASWALQLADQLRTAPVTTAPATAPAATRPAATQPMNAERFTRPEKTVTSPTGR